MLFINYCKKVLTGFFFFISLFIIAISCDSTEPPTNISLTLKLEDVSCTEAWLQLTTNNIQLPATINLLINNSVTQTFSLSTNDSVLYIDSLLPNQTYKLIAAMQQSNNVSNEVTVTTMDTTSQNFTWQTFTFGERTSTLYDVAIIDENNIWAVGEIYMNDSLGQSMRYNAIHWNGSSWELKRLYYYGTCSAVEYPILKAIFTFSSNNIVVTNGSSIGWFDGINVRLDCAVNSLLTGSINKLWGTSSNDLYAVGNDGNIAHYGGPSVGWKKIESGTTTALTDIYGDGENVFICGYEDFKPTVLLKYENNIVKKIVEETEFNYSKDFISGWVKGIWVKRNKLFSLTFYDLYRSNVNTKGEGNALWKGDINTWGSNAVRGNDVNDIFTAGHNAVLWHYNGLGWKRYEELVNPTNHFRAISITGNTVVVAGFKYLNGIDRYGLITIGKR